VSKNTIERYGKKRFVGEINEQGIPENGRIYDENGNGTYDGDVKITNGIIEEDPENVSDDNESSSDEHTTSSDESSSDDDNDDDNDDDDNNQRSRSPARGGRRAQPRGGNSRGRSQTRRNNNNKQAGTARPPKNKSPSRRRQKSRDEFRKDDKVKVKWLDGKFYNGVITNISDNGTIRVLFPDTREYDYFEKKDYDKIIKL